MRLQDCTYGKLVVTWNSDGSLERIGMVVGITNNCLSADRYVRNEVLRAIPLVQWQSEREPIGIHHRNLVEFKEKMLKG